MKRTSLTTIYFTLSKHRLCWPGHVLRMGEKQLPKFLLYSELEVGKRNHGRPKLRFKDVCKRNLTDFYIKTDKWELRANDRVKWRSIIDKQLKESAHMKGMIKPYVNLSLSHCI